MSGDDFLQYAFNPARKKETLSLVQGILIIITSAKEVIVSSVSVCCFCVGWLAEGLHQDEIIYNKPGWRMGLHSE